MEALAGRPDLVWQNERISAPIVAEALAGADPRLVVYVRNPPPVCTSSTELTDVQGRQDRLRSAGPDYRLHHH
jgi:hypothetical protein